MLLFTAAALLALLQDTDGPSAPEQTPPSASCEGAGYAAFDFWLGEWNVYQTGTQTQVGSSRIEKVSNGCAVRETWVPSSGGTGASLSTLDPETGTWHQLWVGAQPGRVFFEGGPVDDTMVLTGYWGRTPDGVPTLVRMTYTPAADGSVRQHGQASTDHGASWSDSFDLTYRPAAG